MLVIPLVLEAADADESDAKLAASRRNTAARLSPEADAGLPIFKGGNSASRIVLQANPRLCPADGDLPDVMDTLRFHRRVSPEADADLADLAPPLGLARSCFRVIVPTYTHLADPTYRDLPCCA